MTIFMWMEDYSLAHQNYSTCWADIRSGMVCGRNWCYHYLDFFFAMLGLPYLSRASCPITTLQQLYEASGDAKAYGLSTILATHTRVASVIFLSEDILSRMNVIMQRKHADFSKLLIILTATADQLEHLRDEKSEWLKSVEHNT